MICSRLNLPVGIGTALQVAGDLRVGRDAVSQGHHLRIITEHRLILHHRVLQTAVAHHITPHQLKRKH